MPAAINCIFTKVLIPFVEREVGPEGVAAILRTAGRSRDYLVADHNFLPLATANELVRLSMELMGETDEERWTRRYSEYLMEWRPARADRHYLGTYSMALGEPRRYYERCLVIWGNNLTRLATYELVEIGRSRARFRWAPEPDERLPRWACSWVRVSMERAPVVWGLPPATVTEVQCAARGAPSCIIDVRWTNPPLGREFWGAAALGASGSAVLAVAFAVGTPIGLLAEAAIAGMPLAGGIALGAVLRERRRRRKSQELLDLQSEEIIYSNRQLERKFRDLEDKIEQLSLLSDLAAAVNATLDPEKIYEQALDRLVHRMGYERAQMFVADHARGVLRGERIAGGDAAEQAEFLHAEMPLDANASATARAVLTGLPVHVADVESEQALPIHQETARAHHVRSFISMPLRVKERVYGVLNIVSGRPNRFGESDVDLVAAVANHVALAVDRAESFRTIEELTRGLEDKVRVRTEQLRGANEELQAAYRDLQAAQMQLVQREKMASVGQLVAGVAHELNNPIGFVFSNVTTLDDFVRRLRSMLEEYRRVELPEAERGRIDERWSALKVDYALKYLDSMIQGIREGAERARKIVRDLRVFARGQDEVWQPVDLHEEIESSLTLLNHLLKDRVTVHRKFGELPSVECIRSQIDQVFLNLLANAAQAITGPGEITIETRRDGDTAVVAIRDTGPGIPPEVAGRIFDPFFTTKPVGEGTGLGLSISYEIVKKHGGEIRAESPPGGGAVFAVRLPLARRG
ncbi:MAG: GAF domain-containing protein [Candidatus Rokubacteria bacterium]|nr:GAF domain-containing protein [Candidatus Rokubacteria bacterium]